MPSHAFAEFRGVIGLAAALHSFETTLPDPPDPNVAGQVDLVRALRGGAIVLMVGAFERFVAATIAEHLQPFGTPPPPKALDQLPEKLRIRSVFKSLEHAMYGPRHGAPRRRLARLADIKSVAVAIASGLASPEALGMTDGNVTSEQLVKLLRNLGINDPFAKLRSTFDQAWGKREAQPFVHDKLNAIVQSRHRVAHAADVLNVSRLDVAEGIRFLQALAESVDVLLGSYVAAL